VWRADRSKVAGQTASEKYGYLVEKDKPVAVVTESVRNDGGYTASYELFDGWLRPRQTQTPGPENGRFITDTFYTSTGQSAKVNSAYFAAGVPEPAILKTADGSVDGQVSYVCDGADRIVAEIALVSGNEKWRSISSYHGDRVDLDPPTGGTPTSQLLDARGQLVELRQYHGDAPTGAYDSTRYGYTADGKKDSVVDSSGNTWRYYFDKRGRMTRTDDPDTGQTDYQYDSLDRQITMTDSRKESLYYAYDKLGSQDRGAPGPRQLRREARRLGVRHQGQVPGHREDRSLSGSDRAFPYVRRPVDVGQDGVHRGPSAALLPAARRGPGRRRAAGHRGRGGPFLAVGSGADRPILPPHRRVGRGPGDDRWPR
jgi:YD repeat-containing protein